MSFLYLRTMAPKSWSLCYGKPLCLTDYYGKNTILLLFTTVNYLYMGSGFQFANCGKLPEANSHYYPPWNRYLNSIQKIPMEIPIDSIPRNPQFKISKKSHSTRIDHHKSPIFMDKNSHHFLPRSPVPMFASLTFSCCSSESRNSLTSACGTVWSTVFFHGWW